MSKVDAQHGSAPNLKEWEERRRGQAESAEASGDHAVAYTLTITASLEGALISLRTAGLDLEEEFSALKASGPLIASKLMPIVKKARAAFSQSDVERSVDAQAGLNALEAVYALLSSINELGLQVHPDLRQRFYELLALAHKCGAAEAMLAYVRQGFADEVSTKRSSRKGRQAGQAKQAQARVELWHGPAQELARSIASTKPSISNSKIAAEIQENRWARHLTVSHIAECVGLWREAGLVPRKA